MTSFLAPIVMRSRIFASPQGRCHPSVPAETVALQSPPAGDTVKPHHIDSAQKAASLPALNAAVVASIVPYAIAASIGGSAMQASLHLKLGDTQGDVVYRMDDPAHPSLQAVGSLDDHTFKEFWTVDDDGLHIAGSYGASTESLRVAGDGDGYRLDGTIGDYAVTQHITWKTADHTLTVDGTLGGLPYHQTVSIDNNPSMPEVNAQGALGNDAIKIGWMAMPHHANNTVDVSADGQLIGQPFEMEGTVQMLPPGTHPKLNLEGEFDVDGKPGNTVEPGDPSHWTLMFKDANTHVPVLEYELDHGKYMHMVAVSRDLSTFAHIHPTFDPQYGHFDIDVNTPSSDPDNQDTASVVTKPGPVMVWTEMQPKDQDVTTKAFTVQANGVESPQAISPDPVLPDGSIRKYFTADGKPGQAGDAYQITLKISRTPGMVHLNYNLQQAVKKDRGVVYADIKDLQPWLGMMGHAIVISAAGDSVDDKFFAHLHAGHDDLRHPSTGPDEMFMISETPPDGVYKIWGQFKHHDKILTLPFVFDLSGDKQA